MYCKNLSKVLDENAKGMSDGCKLLIVKHFYNLPVYLGTLSTNCIVSGFKKTGIYPYNPTTMLCQCSDWEFYNEKQREQILGALPSLESSVAADGIITDVMMDAELDLLKATPSERNKKAKDDRVPMQRRSMLFLDPNYSKWKVQEEEKKEEKKRAMAEEAERKAAEKAQKREEKQRKQDEAKERGRRQREEMKELKEKVRQYEKAAKDQEKTVKKLPRIKKKLTRIKKKLPRIQKKLPRNNKNARQPGKHYVRKHCNLQECIGISPILMTGYVLCAI